jgi:hypothetical protein
VKIEEEIEYDIRRSLEQIQDQLLEGKIKTLKLLINKYCHLNVADAVLQKNDLQTIKEHARKFFTTESFPKYVGDCGDKIEGSDIQALAIVEGTISHLTSKQCFKRNPKFDYTRKGEKQ